MMKRAKYGVVFVVLLSSLVCFHHVNLMDACFFFFLIFFL